MQLNRLARFQGCLVGLAVGDAMGAPVEGMKRQEILNKFGVVDKYVNGPHRRRGQGQWTDDTALSLATMDSIIARGTVDVQHVKTRLTETFQEDLAKGTYGLTTVKALTGNKVNRRRAGNGAAMRIAPVALFSHKNFDQLREDVTAVSRLTHTNPESIDGALAIAFAVALGVRNELRPNSLIMQARAYLGPGSEMSYKLSEVEDLVRHAGVSVQEGLEHIGTRGYVLESVGSAFFAFLKSPQDFRQSIVNAVNAGGDTDTIGSMAGAISGTYNGLHGIPGKWVRGLESRSVIEDLGQVLHFTLQP
jgi:ADP-ribosylglycohydrolase